MADLKTLAMKKRNLLCLENFGLRNWAVFKKSFLSANAVDLSIKSIHIRARHLNLYQTTFDS